MPPPPPPRPGQSKPVSGAAKTAPNSLVANFDSTAPLSGNYRVKWRGKTTEEIPFPSIMKQVEAGELGMMSQILVNDQWLTIRDFLAKHKQAGAIRIAEERRRTEEEKARQLAEERAAEQARLGREKALEGARQHELAIARARAPIAVQYGTASGVNQFLTVLGALLLIAGGVGLVYYWQFFDTTVDVDFHGPFKVHNFGLMQDRQTGIIVSGIAAALGFFCVLLGLYAGRK